VVGIIVGTYSSIFIASPILIYLRNWLDQRAGGSKGSAEKVVESKAARREQVKAAK
jgi:preprotein translocase subunit SecF